VRTRNLILLTAAELFAAGGFQETSIKDVADHVGMTKGAVYHHFPSKEILAISVVEEHYRRWPILLQEVRNEDLSPLNTAVALLDKVAEAFRSDPIAQAGARLQLERSLIGSPLPAPYVGWAELLSGIFSTARESGELRSGVEPDEAARTVVAAFFGMQHISDTLHARSDVMERWAETRNLLFFAIRAA
jgi:AcrR family transcriptional regulator